MTQASGKATPGNRLMINEDSVPKLPRHVKLRYNEPRKQWVLLAPERLLVPDETSVAILQICDGQTTVGAIIDRLATQYDAPREVISNDVKTMLQGLADKGFVLA